MSYHKSSTVPGVTPVVKIPTAQPTVLANTTRNACNVETSNLVSSAPGSSVGSDMLEYASGAGFAARPTSVVSQRSDIVP